MSTFLTTVTVLIALAFAIETTSLSVESSATVETCGEPGGTLPPPQ